MPLLAKAIERAAGTRRALRCSRRGAQTHKGMSIQAQECTMSPRHASAGGLAQHGSVQKSGAPTGQRIAALKLSGTTTLLSSPPRAP